LRYSPKWPLFQDWLKHHGRRKYKSQITRLKSPINFKTQTPNQFQAKTMRTVIFIAGFFILVSCAVPQKDFAPDKTLEGVETILIMPFENLYAAYGDRIHIDCSFCNQRHVVEDIPEGTVEFMTETLKSLLMNDKTYRFIFADQTDEMHPSLPDDQHGVVRMTDLIATSGDMHGVDAILFGYLFHFKERVGTSYSVESPASVSFSLFLVRVADGRIVWRGIFEETQQSLSENILKLGVFIKRKARWITAREMAAEGLENLISTIPKP
jgi:hypothetical protein